MPFSRITRVHGIYFVQWITQLKFDGSLQSITLKREPVQIPRSKSLSSELIVPKAPMPMAPPKDRRPKNLSTLSIRGSFDEQKFQRDLWFQFDAETDVEGKGEKSKWKIVEEDKETEGGGGEEKEKFDCEYDHITYSY